MVSAEDLSEAIGTVGAVAQQSGVQIQQLEGWTTALVSATGIGGAEAGTAIKSMISRVYRLGTEGEEDAGKAEEQLKSVGVSVRNQSGTFRDFSDILDDVAKKWVTMNSVQKMSTSQAIAGTHHFSKLQSLMENYALSQEATSTAIDSENSALIENEKYLNSVEGRMKTMKVSLEQLYATFISSDSIKDFITLMSGLITGLQQLTETFGSLNATIMVVAPILMLSSQFRNFTQSLSVCIPFVDVIQSKMTKLTTVLTGSATAAKFVGAAVSTIAPLVIVGAIIALVKAIDYFNVTIEEQKEKVEKLSQAHDELKSKINGLEDELKTTSVRIDELNAKDKLSIIEQDELEKLKLSNKELEARISLLKIQEEFKAKELGEASLNLYNRLQPNGAVSRESIDRIKQDTINNAALREKTDLNSLMAAYENFIQLQKETTDPEEIISYGNIIDDIKKKITEQSLSLMDVRNKLRELPNPTEEQKQAIDSINKSLGITQSLLKPEQAFEDVWKSLDKEQQKYLQTLAKTNSLMPISTNGQNALIQKYSELFNLVKYGNFTIEDLQKAIKATNDVQEENAESTGLVVKKTEELDKVYKDTTSDLKELNQAIYDIGEGESFSAEQVEELILKYPQLADYVKKTADGYTIEKQALDILNQVRGQSATTAWLAQAGITQAAYDNLKNRLDAYKIEVEAIGGLSDAYKAMMPYMASGVSGQLVADTLKYGQAVEKLNALKTTLNDPKYGVTKIKDTKESASTGADYDQKYTIEFSRQVDELDRKLKALNAEYETLKSTTTDYIAQQAKLNEIIDTQIKKQDALKVMIGELKTKRDSIGSELLSTYKVNINSSEDSIDKAINKLDKKIRGDALELIKDYREIDSEMKDAEVDFLTGKQDIFQKEAEKLQLAFDAIEDGLKPFDKQLKEIDNQLNAIDSTDFRAQLELNQAKVSVNEKYIRALESALADLQKQMPKNSNAASEFTDKIDDLQQRLAEAKNETLANLRAQYETQKAIIEESENKVIEIIRKRYELEQEFMEEQHKKQDDIWDKQLESFKEMQQKRLDILEDTYNAEDYLADYNADVTEKERLEKQLNTLRLDDSIENRAKIKEVEEKLAQQTKKINDNVRKHERDLLKDKIQDDIKAKEKEINNNKDAADEELEQHKKRIEEQLKADKLYAAAREAITSGMIEQFVVVGDKAKTVLGSLTGAYANFENQFGTGMSTLGDAIKEKFISQLIVAKTALEDIKKTEAEINKAEEDLKYKNADLITKNKEVALRDSLTSQGLTDIAYNGKLGTVTSKSGNATLTTDVTGLTNKDGRIYATEKEIDDRTTVKIADYLRSSTNFTGIPFAVNWDATNKKVLLTHSATGETEYLNTSGMRNVDGHFETTIADLKERLREIGFYQYGGIIEQNQIAMLHGSTTDWEAVLRKKQLTSLVSDAVNMALSKVVPTNLVPTPNLATSGLGNNTVLSIENLINIEGSVNDDSIIPKIHSAADEAIQKVIDALNLRGGRRK